MRSIPPIPICILVEEVTDRITIQVRKRGRNNIIGATTCCLYTAIVSITIGVIVIDITDTVIIHVRNRTTLHIITTATT